MNKLTFIKKSLVFLFLTFGTLFSVQSFIDFKMDQIKSGYVGKINNVINNTLKENIIIWGASTAEAGLIPSIISKELNTSVFNMGLSGTNIHQYAGLLLEYLKNASNKKIVIALDIHGGLTKRESIYKLYDWMHVIENKNIYHSLNSIDPKTSFKARYIPFYKLLIYGKHSLKNLTKSNNITNKNLGYVPRYGEILPPTLNDTAKFTFAKSDLVLYLLENVCKKAVKGGNEVFILLTPCAKDIYDRALNTKKITSSLKKIESENIHFLNFASFQFNRNLFKDNMHLNHKGASSFSYVFSQSLKKFKK